MILIDDIKRFQKYFGIAALLVLIFLVYRIIEPYLVLIVSGGLLAYIFYPLYDKLRRKINRKTISAVIMSILVVLIILVPTVFMVVNLQEEATNVYWDTKEIISGGIECSEGKDNVFCDFLRTDTRVNEFMSLEKITSDISKSAVNWITNFALGLPKVAFHFFVIMFIMLFMFRDGKHMTDFIINNLKFKKKTYILNKIRGTIDSIIYGNIVIAIIQGVVGGLGLWVLGMSSPVLWGLVMGLFSLVPFIGTAIVWLPGSIYLAATGLWIKGIILLLYGSIIVGGIDTFLKPILIGDQSNIHPIIVLIGVLGGIPLFGALGVILGPLVLGITITVMTEFLGERNAEIES